MAGRIPAMFSPEDFQFMRRALLLGARALEATPNPRVGCVIVRDTTILAEGWTQKPGSAHAEADALARLQARGASARGTTVYVTLEPCAHFGRTPPCATALIQAGVARVIVATEDPHPLVAGRGLQMLRDAGIDVRCGLLAGEARNENIGFFSRVIRERPWVRLKIAASLDGRTALENGVSKWLTGEAARLDGHRWRARACAVMTGIGTIEADDPQLTARGVGALRQPIPVIVDSHLRISAGARLFDGRTAIIAHARERGLAKIDVQGVELLALPGADSRVDLGALLARLAGEGMNEVQVEAGPRLSGALLQASLVDEILFYQAPVLLGPGRPMAQLPMRTDLHALPAWSIVDAVSLDPDFRFLLRPRAGGFAAAIGASAGQRG